MMAHELPIYLILVTVKQNERKNSILLIKALNTKEQIFQIYILLKLYIKDNVGYVKSDPELNK